MFTSFREQERKEKNIKNPFAINSNWKLKHKFTACCLKDTKLNLSLKAVYNSSKHTSMKDETGR